jgi:hypothetical protein
VKIIKCNQISGKNLKLIAQILVKIKKGIKTINIFILFGEPKKVGLIYFSLDLVIQNQ